MPFFMPSVTDERDALITVAQQQTRQLRSTAWNLSWEQACATPLPSRLSIAGLLAHGAQVTHGWLTAARRAPALIADSEYPQIGAQIGLSMMHTGAEVPAEPDLQRLLGIVDGRIDEIAEVVSELDLDARVPNPRPAYLPDVDSFSNRWVIHHIITEIARHAGHADLIREAIDGRIAYELNFYAEGGTVEQWQQQAAQWGLPG